MDAATGRPIWSYDYPTHYRDDFGFDGGLAPPRDCRRRVTLAPKVPRCLISRPENLGVTLTQFRAKDTSGRLLAPPEGPRP